MECKRTNECERYKRISWHFEGKLRLVFNSYKGALTSFNFTATERIRKLNYNYSNNRTVNKYRKTIWVAIRMQFTVLAMQTNTCHKVISSYFTIVQLTISNTVPNALSCDVSSVKHLLYWRLLILRYLTLQTISTVWWTIEEKTEFSKNFKFGNMTGLLFVGQTVFAYYTHIKNRCYPWLDDFDMYRFYYVKVMLHWRIPTVSRYSYVKQDGEKHVCHELLQDHKSKAVVISTFEL